MRSPYAPSAVPADGKTLLMSSTASLTEKNVDQFAPITLVSASPYVVTASMRTPFSNIKELIAYAKASPGKVTFGSPAPTPPPTSPPSCSSPWRRWTCSTSPIRALARPSRTSLAGPDRPPVRTRASGAPSRKCRQAQGPRHQRR